MKAGERDQAWLRVLIPGLVLSVLCLLNNFNHNITLVELAVTVYLSYVLISVLILLRILFSVGDKKTWHAIALLVDTLALTLLACWYHAYPIALLAIFALPFLGYGICSGQKNLYIAMFLSLVLSGVLFVLYSELVTPASVFTPIGIIVVVSFFALYLNAWSKELRLAKDEAESARKSRSIFFANMSHELRTPLHGILGLSGLLNDSKLGNIEQRYTIQITDAAKIMLSLVDNVLDFTRIEENKFVLRHSLTDLHKFLFKIYRMFFYQAKKNHLVLRFNIDPLLHYRVVIGEKHIQQVLINLVANAIKYTDSGFVAIHMHMTSEGKLRFEVLDSGRGISEDQKERIFDRFSQGAERQSSEAGTGLGLTISKQIVEAMGGSIGVKSLRNSGSMFWFEVPCRLCPEFERNCLSEGKILVLRKNMSSRPEYIAKCNGAKIIVSSTARHFPEGFSRSEVHVVILDQEYMNDYRKFNEPFSVQERPMLIVIKNNSNKEIEYISDSLGSYFSVDQSIDESILLNLFHRAIVCKMDYVQKVSSPATSDCNHANSKKIMIAEDNEINREVISQILIRAGYRVVLANDGEEALECLNKQVFDLFIVDSQMPILDGLQTIRRYKKLYPQSRMPIIVLSADVSLTSRKNYYVEGAQKYLCKPVDAETLLVIVKKIIEVNPVVSSSAANKSVAIASSYEKSLALRDLENMVRLRGIDTVLLSGEYARQKTFDQKYIIQIIKMANSVEYAFSISKRCLTQAHTGIKLFSQLFDQDIEKAAYELHYIKGSLSSIGANRFSILCGMLDKNEKLLLINSKEYIIKFLWKEYLLLKQAVDDWFNSTAGVENCKTI